MSQLSKRIIVLIFLIPVCAGFIAWGGWPYALFISVLLGAASWEWFLIFRHGGYEVPSVLCVSGTVFYILAVQSQIQHLDELVLVLYVFSTVTFHLIRFEKGRVLAASDLLVSLGGILYIAYLGSYFIRMRLLLHGNWWVLIALPAVWLTDLGAYLVGSRMGKHKMTRIVSPNKSWEGYIAGVLFGLVLTPGLAFLWNLRVPEILMWHGVLIGGVVGVFAPLGDLAESFIKRQFKIKDASKLLPGHGGILDRIDSWLWAIPIAYFLLVFIILK